MPRDLGEEDKRLQQMLVDAGVAPSEVTSLGKPKSEDGDRKDHTETDEKGYNPGTQVPRR